eukprot:511008_1
MIVRKLPNINKRWQPPNTQNNSQPNQQHHNNSKNAPSTSPQSQYKYKQQQNTQYNRNTTNSTQSSNKPKPNYVIRSKNTSSSQNTNTTNQPNKFKWKVPTTGGFRHGQIKKPSSPPHNNSNTNTSKHKYPNTSNASNTHNNTYKPSTNPINNNINSHSNRKTSNTSNISHNNNHRPTPSNNKHRKTTHISNISNNTNTSQNFHRNNNRKYQTRKDSVHKPIPQRINNNYNSPRKTSDNYNKPIRKPSDNYNANTNKSIRKTSDHYNMRKTSDHHNNNTNRKISNTSNGYIQRKTSDNYNVSVRKTSNTSGMVNRKTSDHYGRDNNTNGHSHGHEPFQRTIRDNMNGYNGNNIRKSSISYQSPRKRKQSNVNTTTVVSNINVNSVANINTSKSVVSPIPNNIPNINQYNSTQSSVSTSSSHSRKQKDAKKRLYELFARDKLIKWIYKSTTNKYEPIFVVFEHYGVKDQIIGRDSSGHYNIYNKHDVIEAPPYEQESIMLKAVEEILRGYQLRFKHTSLRKQKMVEVITKSKGGWVSSGSIDAIFTNVIGFEDKNGNISNIILQDTTNGSKHAFPINNIKENHMLNIETNEKLFINQKGSYSQYVSPSYWINGSIEDTNNEINIEKKEQIEKQERMLLKDIDRLNKETQILQDGILHKLKLITKFELNDKADKKGIIALGLLWKQVLKQNHRLQIKIKIYQMQRDNWKKIAMDNTNENRLLKQQISNVKGESKRCESGNDDKKIETVNNTRKVKEELQRKLRMAMAEQNSKEKQIRHLQLQVAGLNMEAQDGAKVKQQGDTTIKKQVETLHRKFKMAMDIQTSKEQTIQSLQQEINKLKADLMKFKTNRQSNTNAKQETESLQRKLKLIMDDQKQKEKTIQNIQSENAMLKKKLSELQSEQKTSISSNETDANAEKLQRGGGFSVNSKFSTVKEVLNEYQSLRDQQYHNLHCELKKCLKELKSKSWHKLYINQTCHQFMFDTLQLCYKTIRKYGDSIYQSVGGALCIQHVANNKAKQEEKMDYVFHFYLQENYEILFNDFKAKQRDNLIEKCKKLYNKFSSSHLSAEAYVLITRYIDKCCRVCWLMYLQRPKLTLYPKEFKPMLKSVAFNDEQHKKSMGSDRKSKFVLYHIWPTVKVGNNKLDMSIQVIVRDNDVPMNKKKKKKTENIWLLKFKK